MKKALYCIVLLIVAIVFVSCGNNVAVPSDALDLEFVSNKKLIYNGTEYYKMEYREDLPVSCAWLCDSEPLGKAKITREIWNTGSDVKLNEYDKVEAAFDEDGNVKLLKTQYYWWSPTGSYESIFDAEFSSLKYNDVDILSGESFRLSDIAYTDKCIPINSSNCDWAKDKKLEAYNKNCVGQWYSFTLFAYNNVYYLGCCVDPQKGFLIEIYDDSVIEYLKTTFKSYIFSE